MARANTREADNPADVLRWGHGYLRLTENIQGWEIWMDTVFAYNRCFVATAKQMGKVLITTAGASQPVPFLRGILTRSLQTAGLSFEDAYRLASDIRHDLTAGEKDLELSSERLQKIVHEKLREIFGESAAEQYISWVAPRATIYVTSASDSRKPFYRGEFQHSLNPCCLTQEEAARITSTVYEHLLNLGVREISSDDLIALTEQYLRSGSGEKAARSYLNWIEFRRSNRTMIILIGGVSGSGKSTIATELANRLDIVRVQSTDMLREVMRLMIPQPLGAALHTSSFTAWQTLLDTDDPDSAASTPEQLLIRGYQAQANLVEVACEGVIKRALEERVSLILEGVNIQPSLAQKLGTRGDAIIIPIMLGVLKEQELLSRLTGRRDQAPERHTQEYVDHFDNIYRLQSFLLSEADQQHVTVIQNDDRESTMKEIMRTIDHHLERSLGTEEMGSE